MKVTGIIQARMGATRLPGKPMLQLCGKPVIWHMVKRAKATPSVELIVVATTTSREDDILVEFLKEQGILYFRGSEEDVLSRFAEAARQYNADVIVRITADDPLKDPVIIDRVIKTYLNSYPRFDYVSNVHPPTFPEGQDTEVFSKKALFRAEREAEDLYCREHVTAYFYQFPERFRLCNVTNEIDLSHLRWTLDTQEDLEFFQHVYDALYRLGEIISMTEVLEWLKDHPHVQMINRNVKRSCLYA